MWHSKKNEIFKKILFSKGINFYGGAGFNNNALV